MRWKFGWMLAAALCSMNWGCQNRTPSTTEAPKNAAVPAITDATAVPPNSSLPSATPALREEPDSPPVTAVRTVLRGVEAGRLEVLADFLPDSYQNDVSALVRAAATQMPEELWNRLHVLAEKGAAVLKKHPPGGTAATNAEDYQSQLSAALDTLTDANAWNQREWQTFELLPFLQDRGSAVFTAWQKLSQTPSTVLQETSIRLRHLDGDQATLEFQSPLETEPRSVEFVLVEDKWIPESLSEDWTSNIRQSLAHLEQYDADRMAQFSERLRPRLLQIERTLDQMLAADRSEHAQLGWWQIQSLLMQIRQESAGIGPPPRVEIRVAGELTDDELTELLSQFSQVADDPEAVEYVTFPTTTGTVIQLSPVADLQTLIPRLTFVTVKSHNAEGRAVDVERVPPK